MGRAAYHWRTWTSWPRYWDCESQPRERRNDMAIGFQARGLRRNTLSCTGTITANAARYRDTDKASSRAPRPAISGKGRSRRTAVIDPKDEAYAGNMRPSPLAEHLDAWKATRTGQGIDRQARRALHRSSPANRGDGHGAPSSPTSTRQEREACRPAQVRSGASRVGASAPAFRPDRRARSEGPRDAPATKADRWRRATTIGPLSRHSRHGATTVTESEKTPPGSDAGSTPRKIGDMIGARSRSRNCDS